MPLSVATTARSISHRTCDLAEALESQRFTGLQQLTVFVTSSGGGGSGSGDRIRRRRRGPRQPR